MTIDLTKDDYSDEGFKAILEGLFDISNRKSTFVTFIWHKNLLDNILLTIVLVSKTGHPRLTTINSRDETIKEGLN